MRILAALTALVLVFGAVPSAGCAERAPQPPPGLTVDWQRYLGTWYGIARYDHWFERGLAATSATYTLRPDGRITVLNAGRRGSLDGPPKTADGVADITGPASLSVCFFWPFRGDYRVLALDPGYRWVVVGSSSRDYLWFLHRERQPSDGDRAAMVAAATAFGYDTAALEWVAQP